MTKPLSLPGLAPGSSGKEDDGEGEEGYVRVCACVRGGSCVCMCVYNEKIRVIKREKITC